MLAGCVGAVLVVRFVPTLRLQLGALALLAVCLPLGVVIASGLVMFDMHDAEILAIAIASALFALAGAVLLSRWILQPLERLRAASASLARGDLSARASESGPRELVELSSSFNEMATNLEQLFDARRQLVAWASHDLRTPLASLRAMVEALEDGLAGPEEYLPAIREQLETLSLLIEDLFELARIDAGVLTLDVRDEPLGDLVSTCLRALDAEARARNVHLEARLDPSDPAVRIAPDKVERVLLNLLTNALRHTPSDGAVSVVVQPNSDHVVVAVEDTGAGLAPGARAADVRAVLARRRLPREGERRRRARPGDRPGARACARRHDLGREPRRRRRPRRLHAAAGEDARGLDVEPLVLEIEVALHPAHDVVVDAAFQPEPAELLPLGLEQLAAQPLVAQGLVFDRAVALRVEPRPEPVPAEAVQAAHPLGRVRVDPVLVDQLVQPLERCLRGPDPRLRLLLLCETVVLEIEQRGSSRAASAPGRPACRGSRRR